MSIFVIGLVFISTFMHAGWNLLARYHHAERSFYQKMLIIVVVVGFIPAVWSELTVRSIPSLAWLCVIGSGSCAGLYLFFLARAYEEADFTVVYPIARALPVIFVAMSDLLRGRYLTPFGWLGIFCVFAGCILVPQQSLRDLNFRCYLKKSSIWMLLAAFGTIGYTILDKIAAELVQQGPDTAARYEYFYFAISFIPYLFLLRLFKPERSANTIQEWFLAGIAAIFGFGAYWLILWAFQLSPYASYIIAFRQFSIVIGAKAAFILYKEKGVRVRLFGSFLVVLGLLLISIWGK